MMKIEFWYHCVSLSPLNLYSLIAMQNPYNYDIIIVILKQNNTNK